MDEGRNDAGSDGRSVSNHSIADWTTTTGKTTPARQRINSLVDASPSSAASYAGREVRERQSPAAASPSLVLMPSLIVPPSGRTTATSKTTSLGTKKKEQQIIGQQNPHRRRPPKKNNEQRKLSRKGVGPKNKMTRGMISEDGSSFYSSQSMSEEERGSYSDEDDDESDDLYTEDSSNSFVSIEDRISNSNSISFGISQTTSSENTDAMSSTEEDEEDDEDEEEEREGDGSRNTSNNRERRESLRYLSNTESQSSAGIANSKAKVSSKAKKSLKKLTNLAEKAKSESKGGGVVGSEMNDGGAPTSPRHRKKKGMKTGVTSSPLPNKDNAYDDVASMDATSSKASLSTVLFMKTMADYTVKNNENQLLLTVSEHGNVQKLSLQVSSFCIRLQYLCKHQDSQPHANNDHLYHRSSHTYQLQTRQAMW